MLSIGGLIVAFSFVILPGIMWVGPVLEALTIFLVNIVAVNCSSVSANRHWSQRISAFAGGRVSMHKRVRNSIDRNPIAIIKEDARFFGTELARQPGIVRSTVNECACVLNGIRL